MKRRLAITVALAVSQVTLAETFKIEANTDTALSGSYPNVVKVFDIEVYAAAGVTTADQLHAANVLAQYLDNNEDGIQDNPAVTKALVDSKAGIVMTANGTGVSEPPAGYALQDLGGQETFPPSEGSASFDATLEEVWHLVTQHGYAKVFPSVFAESATSQSSLTKAMDIARGGHFVTIPSPYPTGAWYRYTDSTCDYACMSTEYIYWATSSLLGAQANRLNDISSEWTLNTAAKVREKDTAFSAIYDSTDQYRLPRVLPDGSYNVKTSAVDQTSGIDNVKIETPSPSRLMSGVVQLRGWSYDANASTTNTPLMVKIDSMPEIPVEVSQGRADVASAMGLTSAPAIGWSSLFYTGALSNGAHTVVLKNASGKTLAKQTFSSFTPNSGNDSSKFISGVKRQLDLADFPYTGSRVSLNFDQAEQAFTIVDQFGADNVSLASSVIHYTEDSFTPDTPATINNIPRVKIETPSDARVLSGVTSLRGWSLPQVGLASEKLTIQIDDKTTSIIPVREIREDVLNSMNETLGQRIGWSTLFYSGSLENGVHRIRLYSEDGSNKRLLAQTFFQSFSVLSENGKKEYLSPQTKIVTLEDFPFVGSQIELSFDSASQNFPMKKQVIK